VNATNCRVISNWETERKGGTRLLSQQAEHVQHTGTKLQNSTCRLCNQAATPACALRGDVAEALRDLDHNNETGDENATNHDSLLCPRTGFTDANLGCAVLLTTALGPYETITLRMQHVVSPAHPTSRLLID
jgi:hypothetical protein